MCSSHRPMGKNVALQKRQVRVKMITLTLLEASYLLDVLEECKTDNDNWHIDGIDNAQELIREAIVKQIDVEIPDTQEQPSGPADIFY